MTNRLGSSFILSRFRQNIMYNNNRLEEKL